MTRTNKSNEMNQLQLPIKIIPSELYALVLEDANGITYFWRLDGTYDGYDVAFNERKDAADRERR